MTSSSALRHLIQQKKNAFWAPILSGRRVFGVWLNTRGAPYCDRLLGSVSLWVDLSGRVQKRAPVSLSDRQRLLNLSQTWSDSHTHAGPVEVTAVMTSVNLFKREGGVILREQIKAIRLAEAFVLIAFIVTFPLLKRPCSFFMMCFLLGAYKAYKQAKTTETLSWFLPLYYEGRKT